MSRPPNHAEVTAERIERIFADIPDCVARYRALVELLSDYADAIQSKTIANLTAEPPTTTNKQRR
jgi:hydroxypyruvate isomerase